MMLSKNLDHLEPLFATEIAHVFNSTQISSTKYEYILLPP